MMTASFSLRVSLFKLLNLPFKRGFEFEDYSTCSVGSSTMTLDLPDPFSMIGALLITTIMKRAICDVNWETLRTLSKKTSAKPT